VRGVELQLPWGNETERLRGERIAAAIPSARVVDRQPLDAVARRVAGAQVVIGVDTGLLHLAAALTVPLIAIFVGSEPGLTGPMGAGPIAIVGGNRAMPTSDEVLAALDRLGTGLTRQ
jgi:heptosyltransferase-1